MHTVPILVFAGLLSACGTLPQGGDASPPQAPPEVVRPSDRSPPAVRRSPFVEPPGVLFTEVTQATIATTICVSGWTATVRPSPSFTQALKRLMMGRAGLHPADTIKYELDHYVPLALGGHPRSEENLWLQPWDGKWSARTKDRLERKLQVLVCAGRLSLQAAREAIRDGWRAAYRKYVGREPTVVLRGVEEEEVVE